MQIIKKSFRGKEVVDVQTRLFSLCYSLGSTGIDGIYGASTEKAVKAFQGDKKIPVNGIVDEETWKKLVEVSFKLGSRQLYFREPPFKGMDIRLIQIYLNSLGFKAGRVNGVYNRKTSEAVKEFQRNMGLPPDGIIGESTYKALENIQKTIKT